MRGLKNKLTILNAFYFVKRRCPRQARPLTRGPSERGVEKQERLVLARQVMMHLGWREVTEDLTELSVTAESRLTRIVSITGVALEDSVNHRERIKSDGTRRDGKGNV